MECTKCKQDKPVECFGLNRKRGRGYQYNCRDCAASRMRDRREANPTMYRAIDWRKHLKAKYGLTPERYEELLAAQRGVCGICETADDTRALCVDHCHKTGRVRGLLCTRCNKAIGALGDDIQGLTRALDYLGGGK